NIIVISDEAHRTQGGQLAMNLRNALPGALFIGFTGTPLFRDDQITKRIFGDYVSKYDFKRSVDDGATVPLYYENRGEYLGLRNPNINADIRAVLDAETEDMDSDQRSRTEQLIAREYPILTARPRLEAIARDVVGHFIHRGYKGKAMFIALDKLTTVRMHDLITRFWQETVREMDRDIERGRYDDQESMVRRRELQWIRETEICVVVSAEQNEIQKFQKWGLDIEPHREKMNTQDLETRFKDESDPFRLVIVCAMWITGFDVPCLSTMYIDKPLKAHTLMQAIARANRVNEDKNNGLIVDYIETYTALLDALAVYGTGGPGGANGDETPEPPVKPMDELIPLLEEALTATETFLKKEVNFDLNELVAASGLTKLAALEKGLDAVYTNDETKHKFQVLAREVFRKYKALQPHKVLNNYAPRKNAIDAIYTEIEYNTGMADVSGIMPQIQEVVDHSIASVLHEPGGTYHTLMDLHGINFELLKQRFPTASNKHTIVQSLKANIEKQLLRMVERNPMMVDYLTRYQEIIDDYNRGKDENVIQETFRKLIGLINAYSEEEAEAKREGLNDEQKAVFDILRHGKSLSQAEKKEVRNLSVSLLEELKQEKLNVDLWWEKMEPRAAVYNFVNDRLYMYLPSPSYEKPDIESLASLVFEHLKTQYQGGGRSVYGGY
ncbi:MAG: hypothetical protein RLZZ165_1257, partial [Bacteroidota bacterium]